jgi:hypothetical protein
VVLRTESGGGKPPRWSKLDGDVIERSVIVCETENFSVDKTWLAQQSLATEPKIPLDLSEKLAAQEKEMIEAALRESAGRVFGTFRRGHQTGHSPIYPGVQDSITEDQ